MALLGIAAIRHDSVISYWPTSSCVSQVHLLRHTKHNIARGMEIESFSPVSFETRHRILLVWNRQQPSSSLRSDSRSTIHESLTNIAALLAAMIIFEERFVAFFGLSHYSELSTLHYAKAEAKDCWCCCCWLLNKRRGSGCQ
ncbi:hypothetical protein KQX54_006676 [Cotesia glomerata]|uniref:Uncharacterized protein n=1 Tax=Cotesia glomerata TaxID=32391 RepID=A0AAV7I475_COTGL|nr:hypothetical protein KQX54_006676 [Cotesia glomerata]